MQNEIRHRRKKVIEHMQKNSAALFFAAPEAVRSNDTYYPYRQNSDFWYLTGFNEPDAALLLIKNDTEAMTTILFNRKKDPAAETWTGFRLGQDAACAKIDVDHAHDIKEIKTHLPIYLSGKTILYHAEGISLFADKLIQDMMTQHEASINTECLLPHQLQDWRPIVHELRLFKSPKELEQLSKAGEISAKGHIEAMKQCQPDLSESDLEAELLYTFAKLGAKNPAYNPIVGSGNNACTLHYEQNDGMLNSGDLVLVDAGCEYNYYAGDITRTFPVNGKFTNAQRALYDIVLAAQTLALEQLKPGTSLKAVNEAVIRLKLEGLVRLGILQGDINTLIEQNAHLPFYMHGLGHWLGLDVHDVGHYQNDARDRPLMPGMVLTVEPGLYIRQDSNAPEQYKGIGIRIEDNIVITKTGNRVLTELAPKDPDEIEALMDKKSTRVPSQHMA